MSLERIEALHRRLRDAIDGGPLPEVTPWRGSAALGRDLVESMLRSRHLDRAALELRTRGHGHYTIASAGHESNVVLGRLTTHADPSLVHYRSAALQLERARQVPEIDGVRDVTLSLVAAKEEPASGGRHKVLGHPALGILPSTSTIASHLPRAVGLAFGLERRRRLLGVGAPDAIALASFGDASLNHSTLLGALNAASWVLHQHLTLPLLVVCEDNGLGISVRSPEGWVQTRLRAMPHLEYFHCDGFDLTQAWDTAAAAVSYVRTSRRAAILHLGCARLLGHAGSDVDTSYRTPGELAQLMTRDPLLGAAACLLAGGALEPSELLELDARALARVRDEMELVITRPKLASRVEVMSAISAPVDVERVLSRAAALDSSPQPSPMTLAQGINTALGEALAAFPEALVFGEDVAKKGGVYGVTKGLLAQAGPARVFNTLLDEQTILGLALGTATLGLLPIPEIQYLAYLHNAEDQLRGEAATFSFFSAGGLANPMLVRIAGLAYQKGFGGHFHNDNSVAVLRDIPGLTVICPARGDDALALYRTALALVRESGRVVVSVEPIALYHTRDLYEDGDGQWAAPPPPGVAEPFEPRVYRSDAADLTIATYGNGLWMSLRAARRLERETGARARVLDLRFLCPLPEDAVLGHARETGALLIVDECRRSGSISEALASAVAERGAGLRLGRVTSADSFIPLGDAANLVLLSEDEIFAAARELVLLSRSVRRK